MIKVAKPITIQATPTFQLTAIPIIRDGSKQKAHPTARNHRRVGNQLEPLLMSPLLANDKRPMTNDRFSGGADRDRTGGLLVANQALSQLSYSPLNPAFSTQHLALSRGWLNADC